MGLALPAVKQTHLDVWPENWPALCVFLRLQNQWTVGNSGAIGLNYSSLQLWLGIEDVPRADWWQVTQDMQTLESETLRLMREGKQ